METIAVSEFRANSLAVLDRVRRTGVPVLVTRRGEPIAEIRPPSIAGTGERWLGGMRDSATIVGDLVTPVVDQDA